MEYFEIIFAFVIGITAIWFSHRLIRMYFRLRSWEKVPAHILSKEVVIKPQSTSARRLYSIEVKYTYQYKGAEYSGDKFELVELTGGFSSYQRKDALTKVAKLPVENFVFVNPEGPGESVMNRGGIFVYAIVFVMGILSILIGLAKIMWL